jgi:hypothetical protein
MHANTDYRNDDIDICSDSLETRSHILVSVQSFLKSEMTKGMLK